MKEIRQSGRTSRIVNFVVEQLFSVGECIVTDHISFEYENVSIEQLQYFIEKVKRNVEVISNGHSTIKWHIIKATDKNLKLVHFILKQRQ